MIEYQLAGKLIMLLILGIITFAYGVETIIDEIKKERDRFASRLDYYGR